MNNNLIDQKIIQRGSKEHQQELTKLVHKLLIEQERYEAVTALGARDEKHAKQIAVRYLKPVKARDIIDMLCNVESVKRKRYAEIKGQGLGGLQDYAGIPRDLERQQITAAELGELEDRIRKTKFADGTRYQPLPSYDEVYNLYLVVRHDLTGAKQKAKSLQQAVDDPITKQEIKKAAESGFWDIMSVPLRRKAYQLMPLKKRESIANRHRDNPEVAMEATRQHFDKLKT